MLGKLIKYDFKALKKTLLPLCFGVVALSVFTSFIMKLFYWFEESSKNLEDALNAVLGTALTILIGFCFLALAAAAFIAWFLILSRYYKNLFKDEGYLTFTLPVKTGNILLSKLISSGVWALITGVFAIIGIFVFLIFGTSRAFVNTDALKFFGDIWNAYWHNSVLTVADYIIIPVETVFVILCSIAQNILLLFLAITLGNQIAKKHKIFASVGMYFAVNTIASTIISAVLIIVSFCFFDSIIDSSVTPEPTTVFYTYMLVVIVISALLSLAYFFINKAILKNHLNLE